MKSKSIDSKVDFSKDPVGRLLVKMAMPAIVAMVVNGLYYLVDTAFVGWGVGSSALAGLAVVFPLQMFMIAWGSMLGMGVAALIARLNGEKNYSKAQSAARHAVILAVVSGIFFFVLTLSAQKPILYAFGATEGTFSDAREYLAALQYGFVFVFLSMVGFNIMRAEGDAGKAGLGMLIGTVLNVVLDPLFIFVFHMGICGAAWATVIARAVSTTYFFVLLIKHYSCRRKTDEHFRRTSWFQPQIAGPIMALGLGNFLGQVSVSIIAIIMNTSLRSYGTDVDLAIYGIMSRVLVFVTMPLLGLAQGLQPIAAYNYGSGSMARVRKVTIVSLCGATILGLIMFLLPLCAPGFTIHLFTDDLVLIEFGKLPMRLSLCALPLIGIQILGFTLFQALGQPLKTLLISLSRQLLFLFPLLLILPYFWGINGLWAAFPFADVTSVLLTLWMVRPLFIAGAGAELEEAHDGILRSRN